MGMTDMDVCATDDFTECMGALVYYIGRVDEECKIAYPSLLFDRNVIDGRARVRSVLTLAIGNNQCTGGIESARSAASTSRRGSCASPMDRPATSWT
jgi:hypothetical protein